jgi:DNA-binding IclR family transcriptional regulator
MLQRGLAVLGAFDGDHLRLTLTEISHRVDLPLSTTARLVGQLVDWGGLVQVEEKRYTIGPRIWDLGLLSHVHRGLRSAAVPYLRDVFATTRRNVHLAVLDGTSVLFVERMSEQRTAPLISQAGSRLPLYASGVGKALLAYASDDLVDRVLAEAVALTPHTVVDRVDLLQQLAEVRATGFARTVEEYSLGASSVGVPVLDPDGGAVAAIGVAADSATENLDRVVPVLQVAARALARRLDPRADLAYARPHDR